MRCSTNCEAAPLGACCPRTYHLGRITYHYWRAWRRDGAWAHVHDALRTEVWQAQPSAGIVDSQSVKTTDCGGAHGYDAGKKINGRKRHVLVDTLGLVWLVVVTAASTQDRDGARTLLEVLATGMRRLRVIWADGGYAGSLVGWVGSLRKWGKVRLKLVARSPHGKGFQRLPHRWIVEWNEPLDASIAGGDSAKTLST